MQRQGFTAPLLCLSDWYLFVFICLHSLSTLTVSENNTKAASRTTQLIIFRKLSLSFL